MQKKITTENNSVDLAMSYESMINRLEVDYRLKEDCHEYGRNSIICKGRLFEKWKPENYSIGELNLNLAKIADSTSVLVINEAHYDDRHRVVVRNLLPLLKKKGYRHLLVEGLNPSHDEVKLVNKGIVRYSSGIYTQSTEFANLIRFSQKNGFSIFGYEASGESLNSAELREEEQYKRVRAYLESVPDNEKVIIYCGYGHLYKTEGVTNGFSSLVEKLIDLGDYNVTTVDQTLLSEYNCASYCVDNYKKIQIQNAYSLVPQTLILTDNNNFQSYDFADYYLVHPQVKMDPTSARPSYLDYSERRVFQVDISDLNVSYPVLTTVYEEGLDVESEIPSDLFFANSLMERTFVFVSPGENKIVVTDDNGDQYMKKVYFK